MTDKKQIHVFVEESLHEEIKKRAEKEERTMGAVVRLAIRDYLSNNE